MKSKAEPTINIKFNNLKLGMRYSRLLARFKPQFGNDKHIKVNELSQEITKRELSLKRQLSQGKDGRETLKKLCGLKAKAINLLNNPLTETIR